MASSTPASSNATPLPFLSRADVRASNAALIIIHNRVYNVGAFAAVHPGGAGVLERYYNADATAAFESVGHSTAARRMLAGFCVGLITPEDHIDV